MKRLTAICLLTTTCLAFANPARVRAFSVLWDNGTSAVDKASQALRWSAEPDPFGYGTGVHDKIQVAISPTFASDLGAADVASLFGLSLAQVNELINVAVRRAFQEWETGALQFEVTFDGPAVLGPDDGEEIDVFAAPSSETYFGYSDVHYVYSSDRRLTNGQRNAGYVIVGADVFLNSTRIADAIQQLHMYGIGVDLTQNALQILLAHEVGHALGLGHPNLTTFIDTDTDPFNDIVVDPVNPFAGLIISSIPSDSPGSSRPVMWGGVSSASLPELLQLLSGLNDAQLRPDDHGGRDILYPTALPPPVLDCTAVPEPDCSPAAKSAFVMKKPDDPTKTALSWKWRGTDAVTDISYGRPSSRNSYALCVYTDTDATPILTGEMQVPGGLVCGTKPCWQGGGDPVGSKGWKYKNKEAAPDGLRAISLKPGLAGKAKIQARGKGASLPSIPLSPIAFPVRVQLQGNGRCWEAEYDSSNVKTSTGTQLKLTN